jgi:hypothetical protein
MCVQTITTKVGKAVIRLSCFIHHSLVDTDHVANTASVSIFTPNVNSEIEFTLDAKDTKNLITALQTHLTNIQQAEAELSAAPQLEASHV